MNLYQHCWNISKRFSIKCTLKSKEDQETQEDVDNEISQFNETILPQNTITEICKRDYLNETILSHLLGSMI
jgi:hypothetical protein